MGDPEGVLGGLAGGGATVYLPELDMALVARNTPVSVPMQDTPLSSSVFSHGAEKGSGAGLEIHPVESVQLSLLDQDPRARKNKQNSRASSSRAAFNYLGNTFTSLFGNDSPKEVGDNSGVDMRRQQLTLKAVFKEGQNVIQLVDLTSPQRIMHNIMLPPCMKHISSVERARETSSYLQSSSPVVTWIVSGSNNSGGKEGESRSHGFLSFNVQTQAALFTEMRLEEGAGCSSDSVFTEQTAGEARGASWRAECVPVSLGHSASTFGDTGTNSCVVVRVLVYLCAACLIG